MRPTAQRAAVGHLQNAYRMSERRACRVLGVHRRTARYQRRVRADEAHVRERLRTLAAERPRWGYRRLYLLLKRELGSSHPINQSINHKRVQRLYRLEGLAIRRRKRKRVAGAPRGAPLQTWKRGEAWAVDFMQVHAGRARGWAALSDAECAGYRHA